MKSENNDKNNAKNKVCFDRYCVYSERIKLIFSLTTITQTLKWRDALSPLIVGAGL